MSKIFLCYRRKDNPFAVDIINEALRARFGREAIVRDIDTFKLGEDFLSLIEKEVKACSILVAVIGDRWLDMRYTEGPKSGQRCVDDPEDFVRLELEITLERNIPVIPVLVEPAGMPSKADLPQSLRALIYRGAAFVRAGRDLETDITRLILEITELITPATWKNTIGMKFVLIPAGEFMMGSNDRYATDNEQHVHKVTITQPFYLGKYEVTQGEWEAVMGRGRNPSRFKGYPNRPVENVSWNDVQRFMEKLNEPEGGATYRLPTEASGNMRAGRARKGLSIMRM